MRKEVKEAIADGIEFVAGAIGVAIGVAEKQQRLVAGVGERVHALGEH